MPRYDEVNFNAVSGYAVSADPMISALAWGGYRWNGPTLTYSFPGTNALWTPNYPAFETIGVPTSVFEPVPATQQDPVRIAMQEWADLIPVNMVEVADGTEVGTFRFGMYPHTFTEHDGFANYPGGDPWGGDVWFKDTLQTYRPGIDGIWPHPYQLILHETGHALGLKHPFEGGATLPAQYDSVQYTVMSYHDLFTFEPTTPMLLDVQAIQSIYGANHATRAGNDTYVYDEARPHFETIWDGGGNDTIAYEGSRAARIDLHDGAGSRIGPPVKSSIAGTDITYDNVFIAYGASIENARGGSGNDTLVGNGMDNVLDGGGGLDTVQCAGAHGAYSAALASQACTLSGPEGTDTLVNVERVKFSDGYGLALDIHGDAGQAYRLYQAAFDRQPDLPGLGYQMNDLDQGNSLAWVASNFIASPEFQRTYGNVDDTQFITLLYRNVLDRAPDAGGLQFHQDEFAHGESRADMLCHFSESPENQANVIGQIENGMLYVPLG